MLEKDKKESSEFLYVFQLKLFSTCFGIFIPFQSKNLLLLEYLTVENWLYFHLTHPIDYIWMAWEKMFEQFFVSAYIFFNKCVLMTHLLQNLCKITLIKHIHERTIAWNLKRSLQQSKWHQMLYERDLQWKNWLAGRLSTVWQASFALNQWKILKNQKQKKNKKTDQNSYIENWALCTFKLYPDSFCTLHAVSRVWKFVCTFLRSLYHRWIVLTSWKRMKEKGKWKRKRRKLLGKTCSIELCGCFNMKCSKSPTNEKLIVWINEKMQLNYKEISFWLISTKCKNRKFQSDINSKRVTVDCTI